MNFIKKITVKGWIAIAIVVILLVWLYNWNKDKTDIKIDCTKTPTDPSCVKNTNTTTPVKSDSFPLVKGSVGNNVKIYQMYLNSLGSNLKVDGVWGSLTQAASLLQTGLAAVSKDYFNETVNPFADTVQTYPAYLSSK